MIDRTRFVAPGDSLDHYYIAMRGGLPYDVRAGNTVVVAECFGGSGEVKSAPFRLLEVSRIP